MGWVTLTLRKTELKRTHADYQMRDLQISREKRQMARRYHYEQTLAGNDQNGALRDLREGYSSDKQSLYDAMTAIRQAVRDEKDKDENSTVSTQTYEDAQGKTVADYQKELDEIKEEYEEQTNSIKTYWEDELEMIEEEANDTETTLDQEQVEVEAQMEAVSQEMQAVSEAISSEIQSSTIKLS